MRRLAPYLLLALAAISRAESSAYLKLRAANGITQAASPAAVRNVGKAKTLELSGKRAAVCQVDDTTLLVLQAPNGATQEIRAKALAPWIADADGTLRVLVRCERNASGALEVTLLGAAPEGDVLPAEEAYWRGLSARRRASEGRGGRPLASRGGSARRGDGAIYGPIGRWPRGGSVRPASSIAPEYANFIRRRNPNLSPDKAMEIANDLIRFSLGYHVEPRLVVAILIVESGFDPNSVSHSGAVGLGQLMPETARWMGVQNSYDTTQNLYGMVKLLNTLSKEFGRPPDDPVVLAAYNAGDGAVRRAGGVPPFGETQRYVQRVSAYFHKLRGY